jgi:F0F1-type ATP synthase gamma subunit
MSRLKKINDEYTSTTDIRTLVATYQEIASLRMRAVRDYVFQNRDYFNGLNRVYSMVINSYHSEIDLLEHKRGRKLISNSVRSPFRRNGKTLYILLSANTALYGNIVQETFVSFKNAVLKNPSADVVVTGKVGHSLMESARLGRPYEFFNLSDSLDDAENIKKIQEYLLHYETVVVFHGVFTTILAQEPVETYITGGLGEAISVNKNVHFMFEPSLHEVLMYFENQIITSSFIQSINESYLSKYASRMISLDFALNDIERKLKKIHLSRQKFKHYLDNKKQQDVLAGRQLWRL